MQFCQSHWDRLREKIKDRGLDSLISESGEEAAKKMVVQMSEGPTIDNFDPLMQAHMALFSNVMQTLGPGGTYLMGEGPEDPVEGRPGKTWPRCPLCYISLAHELNCDGDCDLPKVNGYDWMLDKAADEQLAIWKALQP